MKIFSTYLIMLFLAFGLTKCEKKCELSEIDGEVAFYLIDTFELQGPGCQINEATIVLESEVFIPYEDILSYHQDDHLFEVKAEVLALVSDMEHSVHGRAFAVLANNELIYSGYFWPSYSSLSCEWYTIDPTLINFQNGLRVKMGYPGEMPGIIDPDMRNDERILCIFKRDGKLD